MNELPGPEPPEPVRSVRADALARADTAWRARVSGQTWAECARVAGYSSDTVAIDAVRHAYGTVPQLDRSLLRTLWRDRLEVIWAQIISDMSDRVPGATTSAVRIVTAAAALDGLNAPVKVDVQADAFINLFAKELGDAGFFD